jgi:hypothetical protein
MYVPFRYEEITTVVAIIIGRLTRDYADFSRYSPAVFDTHFIPDLTAMNNDVESRTHTRAYLNQVKVFTENINRDMDLVKEKLWELEGYIVLAKNDLPIALKDFRLKDVREKMRNRDVEGAMGMLEITMGQVDEHIAPIKAKGYTDAKRAEMTALKNGINSANRDQELKKDEKEAAVRANEGIILALWEKASVALDAGKRIYRYTNPEKAKEYTASEIKKRIRNEQPKGTEEPEEVFGSLAGKTTNKANDEYLPDVDVLIVETGDADASDDDGDYMVDRVKVGKYTVEASLEGFKDKLVVDVEIKKDVTTNLDIEMEPEGPVV